MFSIFKKGLAKTAEAIQRVLPDAGLSYVEKELMEEILVEADMAYEVVEEVLADLPEHVERSRLEPVLAELFPEVPVERHDVRPQVDLVIGVNGAGKTTTIAKLAQRAKSEGETVLLGAGDTFRAAAIEQLKTWADKLEVPIVFTRQGHDPSGVAYDAVESGKARNAHKVIIDTAGRLHTQSNLAEELKKIVRVCGKAMEGAPHRKILILDGTQGNSAVEQARKFNEMVGIDGIIITKLDGTAKGGAVFSVVRELKLPVLYMGMGEKAEDLVPFNAAEYVKAFVDPIFKRS